jgi:hypothetical protein
MRMSTAAGITSFIALAMLGARASAIETAMPQTPQLQVAATPGTTPAGVLPTMRTDLSKEGWCIATEDSSTPTDADQAEIAAHQACLETLIPARPVPVLQTPGSFLVGYAIGKSSQFVYGPQVGVGAAVLFPLHRPSLKYRLAPAPSGARTWTFSYPDQMRLAADLAFSLSANLAGFTFPNASQAGGATGATATTQQAFNIGMYLAPQIGWEWWDGTAKRVMFSLGILAGYLNTQATGSAFIVGLQPGLVAQF